MTKLARTVVHCQYCRACYKSTLIDKHELICIKRPRAPKRFTSNGKQYVAKTLLPAVKLPPLSLSRVLFMWDQPPAYLMREDAFYLLNKGILKRTDSHSNWFAVPLQISDENLELVWEHVEKARRAGAPRQ